MHLYGWAFPVGLQPQLPVPDVPSEHKAGLWQSVVGGAHWRQQVLLSKDRSRGPYCFLVVVLPASRPQPSVAWPKVSVPRPGPWLSSSACFWNEAQSDTRIKRHQGVRWPFGSTWTVRISPSLLSCLSTLDPDTAMVSRLA